MRTLQFISDTFIFVIHSTPYTSYTHLKYIRVSIRDYSVCMCNYTAKSTTR